MSEEKKKNSPLLVLLGLFLVVAVCAQAFYIARLRKKIDNVAKPSTSVSVTTPLPSPAPSTPQNPGWLGQTPLVPDDDFWGNSLGEMKRMHEQINRLFSDSFLRLGRGKGQCGSSEMSGASISPRLDLTDEGDRFVIRMDLPGADKAKINVEVRDRTLTVSANRDELREDKDQTGKIIHRERCTGNFKRSLTLREAVEAGSAKAKYENGILVITLPKAKSQKHESHKIEIQ